MSDGYDQRRSSFWPWRRRADYLKAAGIAIVTVVATNFTQCAWNAAADAAKERVWRHYSLDLMSRISSLGREIPPQP